MFICNSGCMHYNTQYRNPLFICSSELWVRLNDERLDVVVGLRVQLFVEQWLSLEDVEQLFNAKLVIGVCIVKNLDLVVFDLMVKIFSFVFLAS